MQGTPLSTLCYVNRGPVKAHAARLIQLFLYLHVRENRFEQSLESKGGLFKVGGTLFCDLVRIRCSVVVYNIDFA